MQPEAKFYKEIQKNIPSIIWNRVEHLSLFGMPDLWGYNQKQGIFTVELKVVILKQVCMKCIKRHMV